MNEATKTKSGGKAGAKPTGAFAGFGDMLADGFDSGLTDTANDQMVKLADIEIRSQVREEFESPDQTLRDLGESLLKEQLQPIVLRPSPASSDKPYILVAGERRVRAALLVGMDELRAHIKPMTDAEAEVAQFVENVHRKNLSQLEEAKKTRMWMDQLGSFEAVAAKLKKNVLWVKKSLGLLNLPEQAKRLVTEDISDDIDLLHTVRNIEKADPEAARNLVEELKHGGGKINARERAAAVKRKVKPPKGRTPPNAKKVLNRVYTDMMELHQSPTELIEAMTPKERKVVDVWIAQQQAAGAKAADLARAVVLGFRAGEFSREGSGLCALVAFLQGARSEASGVAAVLEALVK